ncbi:YihY/virulence factor BrkB family protein [Sporosarcina sp. PTS2304]|uniref:YihY/virulence factor BrkB family protein n=1 Tax=Sporosarcina sp. PTS2304 TaxID=2283194 RepID=UPI000E0CF61E|nr:YihY/virulence factor BrkB family protein [Sporosarcina sp. PTS2304]AXI00752.1 YihY/virulence factor BrkB family protein [Sporosarcina sp. PTS2304]
MVLTIIKRFFNERFFDQAAQNAYYLLLSVLPFLLVVLSIVQFLPVQEASILALLRPFVPEESFQLIEQSIQSMLYKSHGNLLIVSVVAALWTSSIAVQSFARSLDLANKKKQRQALWISFIRNIGVTILFMLVMPLSLFLPLLEKLFRKVIAYYDVFEDWEGWLYIWPNIKWGLGTFFLLLFFMLFYQLVPTGKMKWKEALPGALFSAFGWQLVSLLFGDYVARVDYSRLYGQLAGIIMLVLWFYLTAVIIMLSGLLNAEWKRKGRST